jgi:hypothetical protein
MKYLHWYLKLIVPAMTICALLLCVAECLKYGHNGVAVAAALAALGEVLKHIAYSHKQDADDTSDEFNFFFGLD